MTAYLSGDDGKTWGGGLLLDERERVTYPDKRRRRVAGDPVIAID